MEKKVSIIIPSYNVEDYIYRAIESSLEQTYKNVEIVIIDDGSTDRTWDIIEEYSKKDECIHPLKQSNKGVSYARNEGLKIASGDLIIFLDSDDWLEKTAVEILVELAENNKERLVCVDRSFAYFDENSAIYCIKQNLNEKTATLDRNQSLECIVMCKYNLQSSCYKIFRKDIILTNKIKFETELYHGEDGFFVFEYLNKVEGLHYENFHLWNILERPNSATNSLFNEKWLSAITASKKMRDYSKNSIELKEKLNQYVVERALMVKMSALKVNNSSESLKKIDSELKLLSLSYLKSNISLKRKCYFILLTYFPNNILKKCIYYFINNRKVKKV